MRQARKQDEDEDVRCAREGAVFPPDDDGVGGGGAEGDAGGVDDAGGDMQKR